MINPVWMLWSLFVVGQILHALKRATLSVSSQLSAIQSIAGFVRRNWLALLIRGFLASSLFAVLRSHPGFLNAVLGRFGITVGFDLPVTVATAGIYGFFIDSVIDWVLAKVPALQNEVPALNGHDKDKDAAAGAGG